MQLTEKSYSGKIFRPRPEIFVEANGDLLIIATPWGQRQTAKKAIQIIKDYFVTTRQDLEATSPFEHMSCLTPLANDVRIAVKLANDSIYNEENRDEFTSGLEIFVLARFGNEIAWAEVGYPFALLDRPQRPLLALGSQEDLAVEFSLSTQSLPPLPSKLLGLDAHANFSVDSFRPAHQDRLILISRSGLPPEVLSLSPGDRNMQQISQILSLDDQELPFWLGIFEF